MPSSTDSPEVRTGPVQLNGWKEIAAYLGRSVRTVQRWEKDFGLPVRRFGMSKSESVAALPREIDAWLETAQGLSARSGASAAEPGNGSMEPARSGDGAVGTERQPFFEKTSLGRMALAAIVTAVVMIALWAAWGALRPAEQSAARERPAATSGPAAWHVDLDTLVVTDSGGAVLWRHQFPFELAADHYKSGGLAPHELAGVGDVDGDDRREVWFVTTPLRRAAPQDSAFYLFNSDGSVRWQWRVSETVRFGADTFGPTWLAIMLIITEPPEGGPGRAIWAVSYDRALFPSVVQRLDPRSGKPLSAYWSNGFITNVVLGPSRFGPRLFVGACNNEHNGGSLAVLDARNPNGSAPAALEKYRCASCAPGDPLAFLVFRIPARFGRPDRSAPVFRMTVAEDGGISLGVNHAKSASGLSADALYTLDSSLEPVGIDVADGYEDVYQRLAREGHAVAAAAALDPDREFLPILRWDGAARRYTEVFRRR